MSTRESATLMVVIKEMGSKIQEACYNGNGIQAFSLYAVLASLNSPRTAINGGR